MNVSSNVDMNVSANVHEGYDVITESDVIKGRDADKTQIDEDQHRKKNEVEMKSSAITKESDVGKCKVSDLNQTKKDDHVKPNESGNKKQAIDKTQTHENIVEQQVNSADLDKEQSVREKESKKEDEAERKESIDQATCAHEASTLDASTEVAITEEVDNKSKDKSSDVTQETADCPELEGAARSPTEGPEHGDKHPKKSRNKGM